MMEYARMTLDKPAENRKDKKDDGECRFECTPSDIQKDYELK